MERLLFTVQASDTSQDAIRNQKQTLWQDKIQKRQNMAFLKDETSQNSLWCASFVSQTLKALIKADYLLTGKATSSSLNDLLKNELAPYRNGIFNKTAHDYTNEDQQTIKQLIKTYAMRETTPEHSLKAGWQETLTALLSIRSGSTWIYKRIYGKIRSEWTNLFWVLNDYDKVELEMIQALYFDTGCAWNVYDDELPHTEEQFDQLVKNQDTEGSYVCSSYTPRHMTYSIADYLAKDTNTENTFSFILTINEDKHNLYDANFILSSRTGRKNNAIYEKTLNKLNVPWKIDDIKQALENKNIAPTQAHLEKLCNAIGDTLTDDITHYAMQKMTALIDTIF